MGHTQAKAQAELAAVEAARKETARKEAEAVEALQKEVQAKAEAEARGEALIINAPAHMC